MSQVLDVSFERKVELCALWTSAMLCYLFSVLMRLYIPGAVERMSAFGAIQFEGAWLWITIPILIPILMVFLSVALPAKYSRILNIVVGGSFVVLLGFGKLLNLELASLANRKVPTPFPAREAAAALEVAVLAFAVLVVWYAWAWPRKSSAV